MVGEAGRDVVIRLAALEATLRVFDAVGGVLTGRRSSDDGHRLPGVVAGVSRHGASDRSGLSDDA